jgi:hypothetical protein
VKLRIALGWLAIGAIGAVMLSWSWGTWPHPYVDFGRELYVPWQLAEGAVLYRDIAWFNGPLSAYWNALLFELFGPGLRTLVLANLVAVIALVAILYALLRRTAGPLAAFVGVGLFLVLFAFNRVDAIGNDNYLTPYSHEVTHGLILSLAALLAFVRLRARPGRAALVCGVLLGLVALTKAELFVAATGGLGVAFLLDAPARKRRVAGAFLLGVALPLLASFALLQRALSPDAALRASLGAWPALFESGVASQHFYRATLGWVGLEENLTRLLAWGLAWAVALAAVTGLSLWMGASRQRTPSWRNEWMLLGGIFVGVWATSAYLGGALAANWPDVLRPLPLAMAGLAIASAVEALRTPRDDGVPALRTGLLVFAGLLLAKVALRVRLDQYGFALALPAGLAVVAVMLGALPARLERRGGNAQVARAAALGILASVVLGMAPLLSARTAERSEPVGQGRDAFLTDATTAAVLADLAEALRARRRDETLAVLPEGVMINYLARRTNPTGHVNFMPPELLIFGEDRILADFRRSPPDLIALSHKDTREYGVDFFGQGYGRNLYRWVASHYRPVALFGDPPLVPGSHFGIRLLERKPDTTQ